MGLSRHRNVIIDVLGKAKVTSVEMMNKCDHKKI